MAEITITKVLPSQILGAEQGGWLWLGRGLGARDAAMHLPQLLMSGSSTPGESPKLSESGAGTMPLAFRAAKGLQGC